jgi:hypothetical protein
MRVVEAGVTGGPYGDAIFCRRISDFDLSMFHQPERCDWPEALSLS